MNKTIAKGAACIVNVVALTHTAALEGTVLGAAAAPIALVFATADIVVRPMVKGLMADIKEDGKLFLAQALLKGLPAVKSYLLTPSAKICRFEIEENVSQTIHEKLMSGLIITYDDILNLKSDEAEFGSLTKNNVESKYSYVYQIVTNPHTQDSNYVIQAIITL